MKTSLKTFPWGHGAPTTAEWARKFKAELLLILRCKMSEYEDGYKVIMEILGKEIVGE